MQLENRHGQPVGAANGERDHLVTKRQDAVCLTVLVLQLKVRFSRGYHRGLISD